MKRMHTNTHTHSIENDHTITSDIVFSVAVTVFREQSESDNEEVSTPNIRFDLLMFLCMFGFCFV